MRRNLLVSVAVAAGLVVASVVPASATFTLTLDDGMGHTRTITDNGVGDQLGSQTGAILWIGSLGVWSANVDVALSKPVVGGTLNPQLDLSLQNVHSTGPGTLTITITDTGFGPFPGGSGFATLSMGGTQNTGSIAAAGKVNGSTVVSLGPLFSPAWNGTATGIISGLGSSTFSVSEQVVVVHTSPGTTGGDIFLSIVPEPSTLIAGALLLLPFGASTVRILRKGRVA